MLNNGVNHKNTLKMRSRNSNEMPVILDEEQIAARRVPLEETLIVPGKNKNWYCSYCSRHFTGEMTFMKHHCEPRRRAQELMTPIGQAAFGYYRDWMKHKRFSQPGAAAFMESKYYRAFINFAQLIVDANISNPEKYIALMVQHDLLPVLWCRDAAYSIYLEWVDKFSDPLDEVQESINYLFDLCEKINANIDDIFKTLGPEKVLSLVRQRRLTPWLIFCSTKFGNLLKEMDKSQLSAFNTVVNASHWAARFQQNKTTVEEVKKIAKEVGL